MTKSEAESYVALMNRNPACYAQVIRILPESVDPIRPGDNGWDVKITYHYDSTEHED